jgi:trimeric autotransporter adhesin
VVVSAVVNAASWSGGTVAPGELVVIGGTMLGPATGVSGTVDPSTGKMVSQLAGTTVLFNGVAAPLLYTSATQVNAIVPYEEVGCAQARCKSSIRACSLQA